MLGRLLRRVGLGRGTSVREWTLRAEPARPLVGNYRHAELPTVGDLAAALGRAGYRIDVERATSLDRGKGPADPRTQLVGVGIRLRDERIGGDGVWFRVGEPTEAGESIGFVVSRDRGGRYPSEELAHYTIAALGELLPGLRYKDLRSALGLDRTELLRDSLPDVPRALADPPPA